MEKFLKKKILPKLTQEEIETLNRSHIYLSNWMYDLKSSHKQNSKSISFIGKKLVYNWCYLFPKFKIT